MKKAKCDIKEFIRTIDQKKYPRMLIKGPPVCTYWQPEGMSSMSRHVNAYEKGRLKVYSIDSHIDFLVKIKEEHEDKALFLIQEHIHDGENPSWAICPIVEESDQDYASRVEAAMELERSFEDADRKKYEELKKRFG